MIVVNKSISSGGLHIVPERNGHQFGHGAGSWGWNLGSVCRIPRQHCASPGQRLTSRRNSLDPTAPFPPVTEASSLADGRKRRSP